MTIPSSQSLSISPSLISGHFRAPPSKSQTLRALYFSLLAHNESRISHFLNASDTTHMIDAITKLGAHVCIEDDTLLVRSPGGIPQGTSDVINAGNSGIVYRFIAALAALIPTYTVITGDESIRTRRPIAPLLDALTHLGAFAKASNPLGHAPIIIRGPLTKHKTTIIGKDSQPVSSLIYAAAFAPHPIHISIQSLCEKPWIELSLSWLKSFGIPYQRETPSEITLFGKSKIDGFSYRVPGDFSSIAPLLVLAVIQNQSISIDNLDFDEAQGDQILIPLLQQMGANITIDPPNQRLQTFPHHGLQAITIDMDACIDLIPILAVVGCFARGTTYLYNAAIAKEKESDRLVATTLELKKMGAIISSDDSSLTIMQSDLIGSELEAHADHRIAMALTVAALSASGRSLLHGIQCVNKTFPSFFNLLCQHGADLTPLQEEPIYGKQ